LKQQLATKIKKLTLKTKEINLSKIDMPDDKFQTRKGETAPKWMTISYVFDI